MEFLCLYSRYYLLFHLFENDISDGNIYSFGWNENGQLGIGSADKDPHVPTLLSWKPSTQLKKIVGGWYHVLFLTSLFIILNL